MNSTAALRAAYGTLLLSAPCALARAVVGGSAASQPIGPPLRVTGRVLGLRQLAQAILLDGGGSSRLLLGAAVDTLHALSMAGAIVFVGGEYRRPATFEAALATALAAGGLRRARDA